jgi:hypothetical protein
VKVRGSALDELCGVVALSRYGDYIVIAHLDQPRDVSRERVIYQKLYRRNGLDMQVREVHADLFHYLI